ncbi:hypothetical protein BBJ28_00011339 [Nothophytophthora sp. Chile5]|nr:hypothetical protein BBJ28_00011339 [Nothophytophthora sp. Chile5]
MVSTPVVGSTQLQQQRTGFGSLVGILLRVWADRELRRRLLRLIFRGSSGALALAALHAAFGGMCRSPWETVCLLARLGAALSATLTKYVARGCTAKFPSWTLRFELLCALIRVCTHAHGDNMVMEAKHARAIRSQSEAMGSALGWLSCRFHGRWVEPVHFNGLEHLWLRPTTPRETSDERMVVLYVHGGGFSILSPRMYISLGVSLASAIEKEFGEDESTRGRQVDVFLANYRKAPEHCYPVQPEDAVASYKYMLEHEGLAPSQIILAGDSAGGGLVMSALLRIRDAKPADLPLAAILLSPACDLTGDEPEAPHCFLSPKLCISVCKVFHSNAEDRSTWGDSSSVHCDLSGLPPVFVQTGSLDYLHQHATRLEAKARADGATNWQLDLHEDLPHVFSIFPTFVLPYAQEGVRRMAAFAARQFHESQTETEESATSCSSDEEQRRDSVAIAA